LTTSEKNTVVANSNWQSEFLTVLVEIETRLHNEFCDLAPNNREEAVREGVAHSVFAFVRLHNRGRAHVATGYTLARFAALHVRRGRPAAGHMNSKDPLSRYAQLGKGIRRETRAGEWIDELIRHNRAPILDQIAARLDIAAWFTTLNKRLRMIAKDLGMGCTTAEVADKYGLTAGRISQLRRSFEKSWAEFQHEPLLASR
jgi:hypothetical protein